MMGEYAVVGPGLLSDDEVDKMPELFEESEWASSA